MSNSKKVYSAFLVLVATWCAGIVLAPLLVSSEPRISSLLYSFYAPICHQIDGRSLHADGAKLAVCARCSGIYFSFLVSLLIYPALQRLASPAIPNRWWLSIALLPMAVDVVLNVMGIHPSSIVTRTFTGICFGALLPFYLLPPLVEAVTQLQTRLHLRGGLLYARKAQQI
jgi:uncharacterized membrane protein